MSWFGVGSLGLPWMGSHGWAPMDAPPGYWTPGYWTLAQRNIPKHGISELRQIRCGPLLVAVITPPLKPRAILQGVYPPTKERITHRPKRRGFIYKK